MVVACISGLISPLASAKAAGLEPAAASEVAGAVETPFWVGEKGLSGAILLEAPKAVARETVAEWRYRFSVIEFNQELGRIVTNYRESELYTKAQAELSAAQQAHRQARDRVISRLHQLPSFAANAQLHARLGYQISDEKARKNPDASRLAGLAELRLEQIAANRKAESQALLSDQSYQAALLQLQQSSRMVSRLEGELRKQVRNDGDLIAMRRESRELKIEHLGAAAYLDGVAFLGRDAANFAIRLRQAQPGSRVVDDRYRYDRYDDLYGYGSYTTSNR